MTLSRKAVSNWDYSLSFILDFTYNAVIVVDKNGNIALFNESAKNLLNLKEDPTGRFIQEVMPDSHLAAVLRTGNAEIGLKTLINDRVCLSNLTPILKDEEVVGAVAVIEDVTLLRRVVDDMFSSKELRGILQASLENSNEGIVVTDSTGNVVMCNDTLCNFFGVKKEKALGRNYESVFPDFSLRDTISNGEYKFELKNIRGNDVIVANMPVFNGKKVFCAMGKIMFKHVQELNHLINKVNTLKSKVAYYKEQLARMVEMRYKVEHIVGKSQVISQLRETIRKVAPGNANVLLRGNSGTGKELFARALHFESPRKHGPFIKVNCTSIPGQLLEQELFGYEENAVIGAGKGGQVGKLELADNGTLFLNEIGDLSLELQGKLLRFIQENTFRRIGGQKEISVDVRIIVSTNKNLEDLLRENMFREDLYYSLNVLSFYIPPLRDRSEDIEPLINHLIQKYNLEFGKKVLGVSSEVYNTLIRHNWPGNVREIENVMERAFSVVEDQIIQPYHLPPYLKKIPPVQIKTYEGNTLKNILEDTECHVLIETLNNTGGNKVKAAKLLGISRAGLYQKLEKYNLLEE